MLHLYGIEEISTGEDSLKYGLEHLATHEIRDQLCNSVWFRKRFGDKLQVDPMSVSTLLTTRSVKGEAYCTMATLRFWLFGSNGGGEITMKVSCRRVPSYEDQKEDSPRSIYDYACKIVELKMDVGSGYLKPDVKDIFGPTERNLYFLCCHYARMYESEDTMYMKEIVEDDDDPEEEDWSSIEPLITEPNQKVYTEKLQEKLKNLIKNPKGM